MKRTFLLILCITCMFACEIDLENASLPLLETHVRLSEDKRATHSWHQYEKLLTTLSEEKFVVLPMNEMRNHFDPNKVVVGMRHDVDTHPFKAHEMALIEQSYGMRSTYYMLHTAEYHGEFKKGKFCHNKYIHEIYKLISETGSEIGVHNDLLAIMILHGIDPFEFNIQDLEYYKSIGIPIHGTASHGSDIAMKTAKNLEIFSDFANSETVKYKNKEYPIGQHSLKEFGYKYEAYFVDYNIYLSESGGKWHTKGGLDGVIERLERSKPGDRVQILTHPVWWGKR